MSTFVDQMGRQIQLAHHPTRIVSLVPSQTELLYSLGLRNEVVGITKFCVHPEEWFRSKTRIGGTKNVDMSRIAALQPDLIIANKEENEKSQVDALAQDFPVWVSNINTLTDALDMIRKIGLLVNRVNEATGIAAQIDTDFQSLHPQESLRVAYIIWKDPIMTVGHDTFIHHMLDRGGFANVFEQRDRYPSISEAELKAASPDFIFLSSEPYPFRKKHLDMFSDICPNATVRLVDGELFSWYGSRLLKTADYLQTLHRDALSLSK